MCIELDNCAPGIGTSAGSILASGIGLVIGVVALGGFSVDLHDLLNQDPKPEDFDQMLSINASAVAVSGLYVLSSVFLACAVNQKSQCGMCMWVIVTLLEVGVLIYGAKQHQTSILYVVLAVLGCIVLLYLILIVCSQCRKTSRLS